MQKRLPTVPHFFPTRGHLLICTGPTCGERGRNLYREVCIRLEETGLAYWKRGGSVRITESGCLGACEYGPTIACYASASETRPAEQAWYFNADMRLAEAIARSVHESIEFPSESRFDRTTE